LAQKHEFSEIVTLAGTRPEVIKLSEFVRHFGDFRHTYLYTGQHFSSNMKNIFFDELSSTADIDLKCNTSDVNAMTIRISDFLQQTRPRLVIVYGDTNSTLAGALAAKQVGSKVVHLEAGLRSFDLRMPEERNRIKIDQVSDYLLCPTTLSREYLAFEGITKNVSVTGNLIVDVCRKFARLVRPQMADLPSEYFLLTLHRAENVDQVETLTKLCNLLRRISDHKVIFPIHPRTRKSLMSNNIELPENVIPIDPVGYLEFLQLLKGCRLVLTDSGGLQEEAVILGKPCVTLRHTTERWETVLMGANRLYPLSLPGEQEDIQQVISEMLQKHITHQPYGESVTARTVDKIKEIVWNEDRNHN
jgi:UDP-N-acetylglucosamine 2-epimerase (non-hydrolysing)